MLGEYRTTRRRCATSVCSCRGTQAPGQRQWRQGRELQQLRSYIPSDPSRTGRTHPRQSQRSRQPLREASHAIIPSPGRLFITVADPCCLLLVSPAPSLNRDASFVLRVLDTHARRDKVLLSDLRKSAHDHFIILYFQSICCAPPDH